MSDYEYDAKFEELERLEKESGIVLSDSPTQHVGYTPVSELGKVKLKTPLLSLDKTKQAERLHQFIDNKEVLLMLKLDGLTVEPDYENFVLVQACTRGDGDKCSAADFMDSKPGRYHISCCYLRCRQY